MWCGRLSTPTSSVSGGTRSVRKTKDAIVGRVRLLEAAGPGLGRPSVDNVHQSRHLAMKELRAERALRVLFVFDPRRTAVLLIGGHKGAADAASPNWNAWYDQVVPIADDLYDTHLAELDEERDR